MRALGTELNMLKRLGFVPSKFNREGYPKDVSTRENAYKTLTEGDYAHVIYAATYRGKNCRNKTPLDIELRPQDFQCFEDDASFFKRTSELYAMGCYWIGAFHKKD